MPELSISISFVLQVGREGSRPEAPPVAVLGWEARAASLAAGGPGSLLALAPETNAQSEHQRQLPGGLQAWQGPNSPSLPRSPPSKACGRAETLGRREDWLPWKCQHSVCEGHGTCQPPASSGLKAMLEAAVTSTLQILSSQFLLRMRLHISGFQLAERC